MKERITLEQFVAVTSTNAPSCSASIRARA